MTTNTHTNTHAKREAHTHRSKSTQTHKHTYKPLRVSSGFMHGCFCLFTSDNSRPALRRPSQHALWQFIWGNGVPFSLFCPSRHCNYRSSGLVCFIEHCTRGEVMMAQRCSPSVAFSLPLLFSYSFPNPPFYSVSSSVDGHTRVVPLASYLLHAGTVFTYNQATVWKSNSEMNKVGIAVACFFSLSFFSLNHSPISLSTDRLCGCQSDRRDTCF